MNVNYKLPDDLHRDLKIRAAKEGVTLKALILRLLESGVVAYDRRDADLDRIEASVT